jgi:hypothetical protein
MLMRLCLTRVAVLSLIPVVVAIAGCNTAPPAQAPSTSDVPAAAPALSQVERGKNLIIGGGCHDCHTPKKMGPKGVEFDMDLQLSGHPESSGVPQPFKSTPGSPYIIHANDHLTAWSGPWGVSFAANLTPDQNTGLGIWTEDMFVKALKEGKHMGAGREILLPMPWFWYGQLPEDDLKAMFAYLKSIKPIANRVPVPLTPDGKPVEAP